MSNHTAGPWQVEYDELTEEWLVFWKRGYASVGGFNNTYNAHLIAAAPEMLQALRAMLASGLPNDKDANGIDATQKAIAAINKARGKTE